MSHRLWGHRALLRHKVRLPALGTQSRACAPALRTRAGQAPWVPCLEGQLWVVSERTLVLPQCLAGWESQPIPPVMTWHMVGPSPRTPAHGCLSLGIIPVDFAVV